MLKNILVKSLIVISIFNISNAETIMLEQVEARGDANNFSNDIVNRNGSAAVISANTLKKGAVRSIDEALQKIPGVQIRDYTGTGALPKIAIRGFGGQGNAHSNTGLILLDGVNIYGAPYSNIELALFPVTMQMVDHIEVTKGAQGLWAGPNTFSGVINIISKPIPKEWESEISEKITWWGLSGNLYDLKQQGKSFGNNMLFDTYLRTGGGVTDNFRIQAQANLIKGEGFRDNTPQTIQNYKLDSEYDINEHHSLKSYIQYYEYYIKLAGTLKPSDYMQNPFQNLRPYESSSGPATRVGVSYDYDFEKDNLNGFFNLTYFFHNISRNFTTGDKNFPTNGSSGYYDKPTEIQDNVRSFVVNGIMPKLTLEIDSNNITQKIITGMSYYSEQIASLGKTTKIATGVTTSDGRKYYSNHFLATHISDEINLFDMFSITPGIRYDFLYYEGITEPQVTTYNEVSGGLNIGYHPTSSLLLFANYNRSFLPRQYGNKPSLDINYNQHANVAEAGIRYDFDDDLITTATYFMVYVDNQSVNIGKESKQIGATRTQGLELELYYNPHSLEGLNLHFGYNFIDARQLAPNENYNKFLPYVSPHQFIMDISYNFGKTMIAYSSYFYSSSFGDITNNPVETEWGEKGKLPAYYVANLQLSRPIYENGKQKILGSLQVNNIFDYRYYFRGDGMSSIGRYTAPGRSISVQLQYMF